MITYNKKSEITIINPVENYHPICIDNYPICKCNTSLILTLDDIEAYYSKDYIEMKTKRILRETIQHFLGKHFEKYRKKIPLVMSNLYDMEE
ncbi:MAG: hypothetical protein NTW30_05195 [Candidatus Aenigmarchaeota archaeon]|nr:hypothetical protein [Candidatus Aenigmarchaeota archaeon]